MKFSIESNTEKIATINVRMGNDAYPRHKIAENVKWGMVDAIEWMNENRSDRSVVNAS